MKTKLLLIAVYKNRDNRLYNFLRQNKMKSFKKFTLGILGATILSLGLYACSNDDATINTSAEQKVMTAKEGYEFVKVPLPDYLQSEDSEAQEVEADIELTDNEGNIFRGAVRYTIDETGEKLNRMEFSTNLVDNGLITKDIFVSNPDITYSIFGSSTPHGDCVKFCSDNFVTPENLKKPGYSDCIAGCYIESTGRLIESVGNALGKFLDKVTVTITKIIKK